MIEDMWQDILFDGYEYKDIVRGKEFTVHEITYSKAFKPMTMSNLIDFVGLLNFDCANVLYNHAKENKENEERVVNKIYFVKDYIDLIQKAENYKKQGTGSNRQTLIHFKPSHCFQSMQFMKTRDKNTARVVVTMRSCNLLDNFLADLALSWIVAYNVFNHKFKKIEVVMNIASLHVLDDLS